MNGGGEEVNHPVSAVKERHTQIAEVDIAIEKLARKIRLDMGDGPWESALSEMKELIDRYFYLTCAAGTVSE